MNTQQPLVSIIIPTYNRAHLVRETLDSVLEQTYTNWECIVVDDGSTDNTTEVMASYIEKDARFQYHHRPSNLSKGANACRNYGFELSKGEYIQWLDSDDLLDVNKISAQIQALKKNSSDSISICKFGYFSEYTKFAIRQNISTYRNFKNGLELLNHLGKHNEYFPVHVYLTRKTLIEKSGIWDTSIKINQDGVFFTSLLLKCDLVIFVDENVYYRKTSSLNTSVINTSDKAEALVNSWKQIDYLIRNKNGNLKSLYVESAKKRIYHQILNMYPQVVDENYSFFKSIIPFYKRIMHKP